MKAPEELKPEKKNKLFKLNLSEEKKVAMEANQILSQLQQPTQRIKSIQSRIDMLNKRHEAELARYTSELKRHEAVKTKIEAKATKEPVKAKLLDLITKKDKQAEESLVSMNQRKNTLKIAGKTKK